MFGLIPWKPTSLSPSLAPTPQTPRSGIGSGTSDSAIIARFSSLRKGDTDVSWLLQEAHPSPPVETIPTSKKVALKESNKTDTDVASTRRELETTETPPEPASGFQVLENFNSYTVGSPPPAPWKAVSPGQNFKITDFDSRRVLSAGYAYWGQEIERTISIQPSPNQTLFFQMLARTDTVSGNTYASITVKQDPGFLCIFGMYQGNRRLTFNYRGIVDVSPIVTLPKNTWYQFRLTIHPEPERNSTRFNLYYKKKSDSTWTIDPIGNNKRVENLLVNNITRLTARMDGLAEKGRYLDDIAYGTSPLDPSTASQTPAPTSPPQSATSTPAPSDSGSKSASNPPSQTPAPTSPPQSATPTPAPSNSGTGSASNPPSQTPAPTSPPQSTTPTPAPSNSETGSASNPPSQTPAPTSPPQSATPTPVPSNSGTGSVSNPPSHTPAATSPPQSATPTSAPSDSATGSASNPPSQTPVPTSPPQSVTPTSAAQSNSPAPGQDTSDSSENGYTIPKWLFHGAVGGLITLGTTCLGFFGYKACKRQKNTPAGIQTGQALPLTPPYPHYPTAPNAL